MKRIAAEGKRVRLEPITVGDEAVLENGSLLRVEPWRGQSQAGECPHKRTGTAAARRGADAERHERRKQDRGGMGRFAACVGAKELAKKLCNDSTWER